MPIKFMRIALMLLFLAIVFGAFGAHGLKSRLSAQALSTYETGMEYFYYHSFGLFLYALSAKVLPFPLSKLTAAFFLFGIIFFSGFCLVYAVSGIKTFALLVPLGGTSFMLAWIKFFFDIKKTS